MFLDSMDKGHSKTATLVVCVAGLYGSFLTWSVLQERINTKPYGLDSDGFPEFFRAPLVVNTVQALCAAVVGWIYSRTTGNSPWAGFRGSSDNRSLYMVFLISVSSSLSAPIGYQSLKHVDYLAYLLAKSCKLIPVMLVHTVFYRTIFPGYKYAVAVLVTAGVLVFTMGHSGAGKTTINDGNTGLGLVQLAASMLLDGWTNSLQDQLFRNLAKNGSKRLTGASLMCVLNAFVCALTLAYTVLFRYETEVAYTMDFVQRYPQALLNVVAFSVFGAAGQVFVFIILEKFGSLVLVTATVTRKMLSMILSVVLFGHRLSVMQWAGVGLVFGGIGYEATLKMQPRVSAKKEE